MKALFFCGCIEAAFIIFMLFTSLKVATIVFGTGALAAAFAIVLYFAVQGVRNGGRE